MAVTLVLQLQLRAERRQERLQELESEWRLPRTLMPSQVPCLPWGPRQKLLEMRLVDLFLFIDLNIFRCCMY